MKTLTRFIRLLRLLPGKSISRQRHASKARGQPAHDPKKTERTTLANDDSPPGHKVRWHH